jgi:RimJ/RimL family protein N-acetyltransferase
MDPRRYFLRPFTDADYDALCRIESEIDPEFPPSVEDERHRSRILDTGHLVNEKWAVEDRESGNVVGVGGISQSPFANDPHKFWVTVLVERNHSRRGIGRALAALLDAEAIAHRAICFWSSARKDDARSLRFAERQGYSERRSTWMSVLDVSASVTVEGDDRTAQFEHDGIRLTTLADEGPRREEVRRRLHELWVETARDVPRMGDYTPMNYELFVADLEGPTVIPEACFLARHEEKYVACTHLERNLRRSDYLIVGYTGTLPAYRSRGLATELKRRSLEYARSHGIRYLQTFNDSLNKPIWAINEKMGFRRSVEWVQLERPFPLPDAPTPAQPPA